MLEFMQEKTDVYEYLKNCGKPVVIYGMGNGADKIFDVFEKKKIEITGVFASDDFVRGQSFRGFTVKKYSDFVKEFGSFVIVPAFASRLDEIMARMDKMDEEQEIRFPELPVIGSEPMDAEFILSHAEDIEKAYSLLEDDFSKKTFAALMDFRMSGKLKYLRSIMCERNEIIKTLVMTNNEVFADLGAYDGDTLEEFSSLLGGFSRAIAVEPDRRNFRKLTAYAKEKNNITIVNKAVYSERTVLRFNDKAGRNSALDEEGRAEVIADSPDNIFAEAGFYDVSLVKFDVEGAEKEALLGMKKTIAENKPKLCVCAYHKSCDLWELILLMHELRPDYRFFLRKHIYYPGWETVIYAI